MIGLEKFPKRHFLEHVPVMRQLVLKMPFPPNGIIFSTVTSIGNKEPVVVANEKMFFHKKSNDREKFLHRIGNLYGHYLLLFHTRNICPLILRINTPSFLINYLWKHYYTNTFDNLIRKQWENWLECLHCSQLLGCKIFQ